jgi:hypothetical protein
MKAAVSERSTANLQHQYQSINAGIRPPLGPFLIEEIVTILVTVDGVWIDNWVY